MATAPTPPPHQVMLQLQEGSTTLTGMRAHFRSTLLECQHHQSTATAVRLDWKIATVRRPPPPPPPPTREPPYHHHRRCQKLWSMIPLAAGAAGSICAVLPLPSKAS